jgi:hypothetical protein
MQAIYVFAIATLLATLVALGICLLFRRALVALLTEVCEGEARGRFWALFGNACVVLTTLFTSIVFVPIDEKTTDTPTAMLNIFVSTLRGGLFGLLATLGVLGVVLMVAIAAFNARQRRAGKPQQPPAFAVER